ncbi:MAG TPA: FG-GAP-like repeat-containing protein [Terriglobia bacterium]|nr:FG-GAP-like repeat-containing protein [Terriglobia bacterium]
MSRRKSDPDRSRRKFLKNGARLAGSWALGAAGLPLLARPRAILPEPPFSLDPVAAGSSALRRSNWSPLGRALSRFENHQDRFACERRFRTLMPAFEQLRAVLRSGGAGLEVLLAPGFRGGSLKPERESVLRRDAFFEVRRTQPGSREAAPEPAAEFCSSLRQFLGPHSPLSLGDLDCFGIAAAIEGPDPNQLRSQVRFELAGPAAPGTGYARWQAVGEWEIGWERPAIGDWQIAAWQPIGSLITHGPERVFTDVTAAAFGRDPSYAAHLIRDTNYWRTVLDTASGIDIFGNYGVSVGDVDGDGRDEIYLCQPQGLPNRLYRQRAPGVFEDFAAAAGLDLLDSTSMALFADVLNRGRQDVILITESSPLLFLNEGGGKFKLKRDAFPAGGSRAALTGAALADYDRDGYLDLYVCAYGYFQGQGTAPIPAPYYDARNGPPNSLYRNRGDGTFVDVTESTGLNHGNDRFSFSCVWTDIDDDGWPDLVVVNDFGRDNLYRNLGNGKFEEIEDGVPAHGAGMSASVTDFDGDGRAELYVANMSSGAGTRITSDPEFRARFSQQNSDALRQFSRGNALYRLRAQPRRGYERVPDAAGAAWGRWAWCSDHFDLANTGHPDLYVVNGFLSAAAPQPDTLDAYLWQDVMALSPQSAVAGSDYRAGWSAGYELAHRDHSWDGYERNAFFLNLGDGSFADASAVTGLDFRDDGRSFAVFDFDGDGDADLVIHSRTGPQLRLLRNDLASGGRSIAVRLRATRGNRDAIGARVEIETPKRRIVRWLGCGSGFQAQHSKELLFGLGDDVTPASAVAAHVRWPGGNTESFLNLAPGYRYSIVEGEAQPKCEAYRRSAGLQSHSEGAAAEVEPPPDHFSTRLIDPLPLPPLPVFSLPRATGTPRWPRSLIWIWEAGNTTDPLPATLLAVQKQLPSRLIVWSGSPPAWAASQLALPAIQADERLRTFLTTLLSYVFDRRRPTGLPTGLLIDRGTEPEPSSSLIKIYWGGAAAEEILTDARASNPTGAAALPFPGQAHLCSFSRDTRVLGAALAFAGLYAESEPYLARAVNANRQDADAAYNLALAARELNKPDLALNSIQTALAARPHFPEAENLLGVLLMQSGRMAEARAPLASATAGAPDFAEAWNNLGYLSLMQGDLASARASVARALQLAPEFPEALNNLGIIAAREGKPDEAGALFRRSLAADPQNEQAGNNLGVLQAQQGHVAEAIATFKSVLERNPEASSVLLNLARLDLSTGQSADALRVLEPWLARHPNDAAAQQLIARARAGQTAPH